MRNVQGDGNDLYLDCEGGCRQAFIFQDSSNCTCKGDPGEKGEHGQKREGKPRGLLCQGAEGKELADREDLKVLGDSVPLAGLDRRVWNICESEGEAMVLFRGVKARVVEWAQLEGEGQEVSEGSLCPPVPQEAES